MHYRLLSFSGKYSAIRNSIIRNFAIGISAFIIIALSGLQINIQDVAAADEAKAIPPQSAPANSAPPDPTIKTTGDKSGAARSHLIQKAPLDSDYVLGNRKAPVLMIEYASLSCPHCAHFSVNILGKLEEKYIKTGKLAYILRQFPLNEPAMRGAMLTDCVGQRSAEQYYTFSRVLFEAQKSWAFDSNFISGLETIAGVGGLSKQQFASCINDKEREMKILSAKKLTNDELKIPHTPYFFIDKEKYEGEMSFEAMAKIIEEKLAKNNKQKN